jgi:hypothetical protein
MGLLAWICKIKDTLHECAESIRHTEERKRHQKLPGDQPTEVRAVVSFDEKTVADTTTQDNRQHATQESIKSATWYAVVAASIYALISLLIWCQIRVKAAALGARCSARYLKRGHRRYGAGIHRFGSRHLVRTYPHILLAISFSEPL